MNKRLALAGDKAKVPYPPSKLCPQCYKAGSQPDQWGSFADWDTVVFPFLQSVYLDKTIDGGSGRAVATGPLAFLRRLLISE